MGTRVLIATGISIAVAVALGAGLGFGLHNANTREDSTSASQSRTASPTTSETATNTIAASGTYALSLSNPTNVQAGCLTDSSLNPAWDCNLAGPPGLAISVGVPAAPQPTEGAFFFYASNNPGSEYGAQYTYMNTDFASYQAVQESGEDDKGPAFYFGQFYDKIVLLPESTFPVPSRAQKKRNYQVPSGFLRNRQFVSHGDKPWMCIWNDTLIEGWIYVQQNITSSLPITTSSSALGTATSHLSPTEDTVFTYTLGSSAVSSSGSRTQVTTSQATVASSSQTSHKDRKRQLQKRQTASSALDDSDEVLTPAQEEALDTYPSLPPYPYLIKIEERRVPFEGSRPYCQQFQMLDSGDLIPFSNDGNPSGIKFDLAEQPPAYSSFDENASVSVTSRLLRRQTSPNACHCEWWTQ